MKSIVVYCFVLVLSVTAYGQEFSKSKFVLELNEYRTNNQKGKLEENQALNNVLKEILRNENNDLLQSQDSLRRFLRSNHIYDYYVDIVKVDHNNNSEFKELKRNYKKIDKLATDSLFNNIAIESVVKDGKEYLFILSAYNYIQFDSAFNAGFSIQTAGEEPGPKPAGCKWVSYGGRTIDKKPLLYMFLDDYSVSENNNLVKNQMKLDEDGKFKLFIDFTLEENKSIREILFFDNHNNKVGLLKVK